jgi:hypothetical protein
MAEPMTMTEAQKVLGRELKPAAAKEDGYLVKYKDGYKSWFPKSVFEETYRPSETVLDKLKIERIELKARIKKLEVFLKLGEDELPYCLYKVMEKVSIHQTVLAFVQYCYMINYLKVLELRINTHYLLDGDIPEYQYL